MKTPLIFGREPAVFASLIEAGIALLISFHLLAFAHLNGQHELGLVMAVVTAALGVYVAWVTHDTLLGVLVGLAKALIALGTVYGLTLTTEQTGTLIAFLTLAIGLVQRTQTGPTMSPSLSLSSSSPRKVRVKVAEPDPAALAELSRAVAKANTIADQLRRRLAP